MDNTTLSVTNTAMNISIEPGGFRVFGNQAVLSNESFDTSDLITLSPNPTSNNFVLNTDAERVQIYSITGQLIKTFSKVPANQNYSVSELNQGIYFVKITDSYLREKTMRLIKD
jgi:hypothetical protein